MMGQDGKQMPQKTCGCEKSMMGQDGKQMSQKTCGCEKSMMGGQDGKRMDHKNVKSMMGGREKGDNIGVKLVVVNINV